MSCSISNGPGSFSSRGHKIQSVLWQKRQVSNFCLTLFLSFWVGQQKVENPVACIDKKSTVCLGDSSLTLVTQVPAVEIKVTVIMIAMYYAALSTTKRLAPERTTSAQACTE